MNQRLCRYQEIFPYKHNTVTINNPNKIINGSWIHIPYDKSFIATQGPPEFCKDDFWEMCFDYNVKVIVMLCNEVEDCKPKCSTYWEIPNSNDFNILNIEEKEKDINDIYIIREITIQKIKEQNTRKFSHFQFKKWPDHKTPDIQNVVYNFEKLFDFVKSKKGKDPCVIHCSAGVGRTGVFLSLYILYREIMENNSEDIISFNIFNLVRKLKEYRMYLVENINQYIFIYYFIEKLLKEKNI